MKPSDNFKKIINNHLESLATADELFAETLKKQNKNIDECITYIFNQVKNSGCNGFTDDEIFGMAVHYYDEDQIEVGSNIDCKVVVNHSIELSKEEQEDAKKKAFEELVSEEKSKLQKKQASKKVEPVQFVQASLF
ncbi:PcfK-like family protein [Aquirufa aurantiipilula]